jgi:hypothetical protein
MGNARLTQFVEDTALAGLPNVRLTKTTEEAVLTGTPSARLTRMVLEMVVPSAPPIQRGNIDYDQVRATARQGPGALFQMFGGGATGDGDFAVYDSLGSVVDGGSPLTRPVIGPIRSVAVNTTMTNSDYTVIATVPSITITLPPTPLFGQMANVKNGNPTTGQLITVSAAVNIDVATSISLGATANLHVQYDGAQWRIL